MLILIRRLAIGRLLGEPMIYIFARRTDTDCFIAIQERDGAPVRYARSVRVLAPCMVEAITPGDPPREFNGAGVRVVVSDADLIVIDQACDSEGLAL